MKYLFFAIALLHVSFLNAKPSQQHIPVKLEPEYQGWFTGPLLAPTPVNMVPGHPAIEPILVISSTYGNYTHSWNMKHSPTVWSINPSLDFQFALSERWGLEFYPSYIINFSRGKSAAYFQDTNVFLGYQIANQDKNSWLPNIRLDLHQVYPTGKFKNLSADHFGIDATGEGAFQFGPTFIMQKQFTPGDHYLNLTWSLGYLWPLPTHVKGINAYGGASDTSGKVKPGKTWTAFFSGEYSFTQTWVFACDFFLINQSASSFSGTRGLNQTRDSVTLPSSTQISITPSLEYNLSSHLGLLFGSWLSIAGRNADAFASLFFACVYVF